MTKAKALSATTEYNLSAKRPDTDKWWSYGKLKPNDFGNWDIGMRVTEELKALVDSKDVGDYINLSVFPVEKAKSKGHADRVREEREAGYDIER